MVAAAAAAAVRANGAACSEWPVGPYCSPSLMRGFPGENGGGGSGGGGRQSAAPKAAAASVRRAAGSLAIFS